MNRYWLGWYEPGEDPHRVVPDTIRYWCTGYKSDGSANTLCAVVDAESTEAAMALVKEYWNPLQWRFTDQKTPWWLPPADRFPLKETP